MKEHQNLFRDLQEDFRKMKKNLLVAQSGGPTAAINATLAGVIKQAIKEEQIDQLFVACYGIQVVLDQKFLNLTVMMILFELEIGFIKGVNYAGSIYLCKTMRLFKVFGSKAFLLVRQS